MDPPTLADDGDHNCRQRGVSTQNISNESTPEPHTLNPIPYCSILHLYIYIHTHIPNTVFHSSSVYIYIYIYTHIPKTVFHSSSVYIYIYIHIHTYPYYGVPFFICIYIYMYTHMPNTVQGVVLQGRVLAS